MDHQCSQTMWDGILADELSKLGSTKKRARNGKSLVNRGKMRDNRSRWFDRDDVNEV